MARKGSLRKSPFQKSKKSAIRSDSWPLVQSTRHCRSGMLSIWAMSSLVPGVVVFAQFSSDSGRSKLATVQSTSTNRFVIVTTVSVIFFPQRPLLKLDGRAYIPAVLE